MEAARWREGEEEEGDGLKVRGHAVIGMLHCGVAVRNKWHSPILWMLLQQQWKQQQQQELLREAVSFLFIFEAPQECRRIPLHQCCC